MASLGSANARRTPATNAAAGPPPGGSSEVKITARATLRAAPTTTIATCSGNEASVRSSSGLPSTCSASLSGAKRCDSPPARTTAVTRRSEGCLLLTVCGVVAELPSRAVNAGGCLGSRGDPHGVIVPPRQDRERDNDSDEPFRKN